MSKIIHIKKPVAINIFDLSPNFIFDTHVHEDWEFIYVDSGTLGYISDGVPGTLRQGEILFHRCGVPHSTICDGKHSASFFNVIFRSDSKALNIFGKHPVKVPDTITPLLNKMIEEAEHTYVISSQPLKKRCDAHPDGEQLFLGYAEMFLLLLRRHVLESESTSHNKKHIQNVQDLPSDEIIEYLKAHLSEKISLDILSEHFHTSKTQLCVKFKKINGTSIINFFLDLKIAEAKKLLREKNMPISNISEALGFESPEYFSRCFKEHVGHSPRVFRRMLISDAAIKKR